MFEQLAAWAERLASEADEGNNVALEPSDLRNLALLTNAVINMNAKVDFLLKRSPEFQALVAEEVGKIANGDQP